MPTRLPKYLDLEGLKYYDQKLKDYINWESSYVIPEGGIPSTDMTQEVQASLAKADTALQPEDLADEVTNSNSPISASAVYNTIVEEEEVISAALNDLNSRINNLVVEETDPTVPAWAKEETKPTYTASEVGALSSTTKVDGVSFNGGTSIIHYTTCSTAAATQTKTVSLSNFTPLAGSELIIKFTVTNTASNPQLSVNNGSAYAIYYKGTNIPAGALAANNVYKFVFDGSTYQLVGSLGVTKSSELTNDAGFLTSSNVANEVSESSNNPVSASAVYEYITELERVIASSLNDLNSRLKIIEDALGPLAEMALTN